MIRTSSRQNCLTTQGRQKDESQFLVLVMARSVTGDSQLPFAVIPCEDVGHVLMVYASIFLGGVGLRVGCERRVASNDNLHIRMFNGVGRGLSCMCLQVLQKLRFPRSGSVGPDSCEIVGQDTVEGCKVRGPLGLEPLVFDLLDRGHVSLIERRCVR